MCYLIDVCDVVPFIQMSDVYQKTGIAGLGLVCDVA